MTAYRRSALAMLALALTVGCGSGEGQPAITAPVPPIETNGSATSLRTAPPTGETAPAQTTPGASGPTAATTPAGTPTSTAVAVGSPRGAAPAWTSQDTPEQVAAKYATATWALDSAVDGGPNAGLVRAAAYATPQLAAQLTGGGPTAGGGAAWTTLAAHHGWTTVDTDVTSTPDAPDTPELRSRQVTVTITSRDGAGWSDATLYPQQVMYVQLAPDPGGGWRVSASTSAPQ